MKTMSFVATILNLTAALLIAGSGARAATLDRPVEDVTVISNGEGAERILFRWEPNVEQANTRIWKAMLRFSLSGAPEGRSLPVVIHPITRPWNPQSVSWESGWAVPGGDYDDTLFAHSELSLGGGTSSIDVTSIAKEVVESGYECYGFLLTVDRSQGIGLSSEDGARFAAFSDATIEVFARSAPPSPRAVADLARR